MASDLRDAVAAVNLRAGIEVLEQVLRGFEDVQLDFHDVFATLNPVLEQLTGDGMPALDEAYDEVMCSEITAALERALRSLRRLDREIQKEEGGEE